MVNKKIEWEYIAHWLSEKLENELEYCCYCNDYKPHIDSGLCIQAAKDCEENWITEAIKEVGRIYEDDIKPKINWNVVAEWLCEKLENTYSYCCECINFQPRYCYPDDAGDICALEGQCNYNWIEEALNQLVNLNKNITHEDVMNHLKENTEEIKKAIKVCINNLSE